MPHTMASGPCLFRRRHGGGLICPGGVGTIAATLRCTAADFDPGLRKENGNGLSRVPWPVVERWTKPSSTCPANGNHRLALR
jgi:hypothetical protein